MANQERKPELGLSIRHPSGELEPVDGYFENLFGRSLFPTWARIRSEEKNWSPSIEVIEQEDKFLVKADLPGVKDEDINVSVTGNTLTIEGQKTTTSETKKNGYHYSESSYGSFSRSLIIPSTVNVDKIDANCEQGVLSITLPKVKEVKPRKIAVGAKKETAAQKKEKKASK